MSLKNTISTFGNYIDFNEVLQLDDSCFYDEDHLNQKGVELYNHCLIEEFIREVHK